MRLKIVHITILLLSLSLGVSAQKKKSKAKQPAHKHAQAKEKKKVSKKEAKHSGRTKEKEPVKAKGKEVAKAAEKDTATLKGATIEILQSYKPEVKLAPKPEAAASLPPVDVSTPKLQYNVPPQSLYYTYNSLPLRPLTLGKDSVLKGFENYIKFGGGNLSTILLDAGFAGLHGPKYETAIHVHHLSQAGNTLDQKTQQTGIEAEGTYHAGRNDLHAALEGYRNLYNLYGFTPADSIVDKVYKGFKIGVDLKQADPASKFTYHPSVDFVSHSDNYNASENRFTLYAPFAYQQNDELKLYVGVKGVYDNFSRSLISSPENYVLQLSPGVEYNKGAFSGKFGLYPTVGTNNFYLLPDIDARYTVKNTQLALFAGIKGVLKQNNYEEVSTWNPYVLYSYNLQQTHANEIFGGVQTNISNHLTLAGRLSYWQYDNMLMFINDTFHNATDSRKDFLAVYDKANAISLQASVRYHIAEVLAVGISGTYTGFNADDFKHVWHEPGIRFNADLMVKPIPQLIITAYLSITDENYAVDYNNVSVKVPGAFDLGGGAEYSFTPRLSAFIQVKNLLNTNYDRWYGYRAYGLNVFGGVRFKF